MQEESIQDFVQSLIAKNQLKDFSRIISEKIRADQESISDGGGADESFLSRFMEFIAEDTKQGRLYFEAITFLHPALVNAFSSMSEPLQDIVRSGLLSAVLGRVKDMRSLSALGLLLREIVEKDNELGHFEEWVEPLGELIKWMGSEEEGAAESAVEFFVYFFRETVFSITNVELPLYKMSQHIFPALFQTFVGAPQEQKEIPSLRQKVMFLVLQIIKTFALFDGSDDAIVKECFEGSFELWMSLFVSILKGSVNSHFGMKKYVIKILTVIFRDLTNFCQRKVSRHSSDILVVWQFVYRFLPCFLAVQVWGRRSFDEKPINNHVFCYFDEDTDTDLTVCTVLAFSCIQLLSVLISSQLFSTLSRLAIHSITNVLFHFYLLPKQQLRTWDCSASYFVNAPQYESLRGKILNNLNELIERSGDFAIQALLLIAEKFLMNQPQSETFEVIEKVLNAMNVDEALQNSQTDIPISKSDIMRLLQLSGCDCRRALAVSGETWHKSEVALSILGRFSEDIIVFQSKQQSAFDIESFLCGLTKQLEVEEHATEAYILKGQSLYCLTRFTEIISIKYKQMFCSLIVCCSKYAAEGYPTPVRVASCKTLTVFLRKTEKHRLALSKQETAEFINNRVSVGIMGIEINSETNVYVLEALIEIAKSVSHKCLQTECTPFYLLDNVHRNILYPSTLKLCFTLLEIICSNNESFCKLTLTQGENGDSLFLGFTKDCLESYRNIVKSEQKKLLKMLDTDLIVAALKLTNLLIEKCPSDCSKIFSRLADLVPAFEEIIAHNEDIQIHIAVTVCLKSLIRLCPEYLKSKGYEKNIVSVIHSLLKIPTDKAFEAASIYVGNLIILSFDRLLEKVDEDVLREVVLKVFRSRTPSVIQSLVLTYAKLINSQTDPASPFEPGDWGIKVQRIVDFLASFSIENRMGLKILTDKWLLQQSLFRGTRTKISTFMALSKLFLLRDKRVDNLLVIGFNPSHTNVNNDVNAPLKILATLIRCLHNEMGGNKERGEDEEEENEKERNFEIHNEAEKGLDVGLEKFKDEEQPKEGGRGLADRENQQGSTCYMSAMLEFYDDGEECDETTEQDLTFLDDVSTKFQLADYLNDFFTYLNDESTTQHRYFKDCLQNLLKEDFNNLRKYIKIALN